MGGMNGLEEPVTTFGMRWLVNTLVSMSTFANQLDVRWRKFSPKVNQLVGKATSGQNK